jgi:predicted DNA-binding transcriptional regulator AlpA
MSAPQPAAPAFLRAAALARHLGISRPHFYRHWKRKLTPHPAGGKVVVYDVAEAEALIRNGGR